MCTVAQLIARLQELPQDAIVQVKEDYVVGWDTCVDFKSIDIQYGVEVYDFTQNGHEHHPTLGGKVFVHLTGE